MLSPHPLVAGPVSRPPWPRYPFYHLPLAGELNSDHASRPTALFTPPGNPRDSGLAVYAIHAIDRTTNGQSIPNPWWELEGGAQILGGESGTWAEEPKSFVSCPTTSKVSRGARPELLSNFTRVATS